LGPLSAVTVLFYMNLLLAVAIDNSLGMPTGDKIGKIVHETLEDFGGGGWGCGQN
jgi:hypothetical protein